MSGLSAPSLAARPLTSSPFRELRCVPCRAHQLYSFRASWQVLEGIGPIATRCSHITYQCFRRSPDLWQLALTRLLQAAFLFLLFRSVPVRSKPAYERSRLYSQTQSHGRTILGSHRRTVDRTLILDAMAISPSPPSCEIPVERVRADLFCPQRTASRGATFPMGNKIFQDKPLEEWNVGEERTMILLI